MNIAPEFIGFLIGYGVAMATLAVVWTLNTKWPLKKATLSQNQVKEGKKC